MLEAIHAAGEFFDIFVFGILLEIRNWKLEIKMSGLLQP